MGTDHTETKLCLSIIPTALVEACILFAVYTLYTKQTKELTNNTRENEDSLPVGTIMQPDIIQNRSSVVEI